MTCHACLIPIPPGSQWVTYTHCSATDAERLLFTCAVCGETGWREDAATDALLQRWLETVLTREEIP